VVFGLWGFLALQAPLGHFYRSVSSFFAGVPVVDRVFRGSSGTSLFTAGLIVAMMITPIITSLTREVFATVPSDQKAAALALGATRWEMMRSSVLGHGRSGVIGAVMLGLGRAMGETIAVALVVGSVPAITLSLFHPGDTMAAVVANQFGEANGDFRAALIGLGVVLFALTIAINVVARGFISRAERGARAR
jgi:phosphate transport system permease protein